MVSPVIWLATSALLRALSGPVDRVDEGGAAGTVAPPAEAASVAAGTSCRDQAPAGASTRIAPDGEPGQRLVLEGRVLGPDGHSPAAGVTVYAYQADAKGRYSAQPGPDDNQNPRLCGVVRTDEGGRFRIDSIRPGAYAGGRSAHIHFEVWRDREPHGRFLLTFEERRPPRGADVGGLAGAGDRTATRRPLVLDPRGTWHVVRDLRLS